MFAQRKMKAIEFVCPNKENLSSGKLRIHVEIPTNLYTVKTLIDEIYAIFIVQKSLAYP